MVRHVIVWTLRDEYSDSEKAEIKAGINTKVRPFVKVRSSFDYEV